MARLRYAELMRTDSTYSLLGERSFAVVDVETTGLNPMNERVIEIGVLQLNGALEVEREWSTLVNPEQHVKASRVHGLFDADVAGAPTFSQLIP